MNRNEKLAWLRRVRPALGVAGALLAVGYTVLLLYLVAYGGTGSGDTPARELEALLGFAVFTPAALLAAAPLVVAFVATTRAIRRLEGELGPPEASDASEPGPDADR